MLSHAETMLSFCKMHQTNPSLPKVDLQPQSIPPGFQNIGIILQAYMCTL
jgi:hypothetical protein